MRVLFLLPILAGLAGCAVNTSTIPTNTIAAAETSLTGADQLALLYTSLPACGSAVATAVCADPTLKAKIKADAQTAYNDLLAAKADASLLASATAAIQAYASEIPASAAAAPATK
jgi:hypothetical protein